jgi:hypothetical protein
VTFTLPRPPETEDELYWVIRAMFGVDLPRVAVCKEHVSPFDAVAHAYFGREPNFAVWYASRGSGKSLALAALGLVKALVRDVDVTILGGSMTQSLNVREHMRDMMRFRNAPVYAVEKDQATLIQLHTGTQIKPLPASQTTVRGPHPPLQLLDEVDEMEQDIYQASLGQAMEKGNVHGETIAEYIVASSTWQNPEGTFTKVIEDAREKGFPIFTWCWRELLSPNGWMSPAFIERKRRTVSAQMWHTEYDLNEPTAGSRALDLDKIELYFVPYPRPVKTYHDGTGDHDEYTWELPQPTAAYAVGADWAKETDKTVITVVRSDVFPHRLAKLIRINRRPWPYMIGLYNKAIAEYQAVGVHDGTGLGNVVDDYVEFADTSNKFVMVGRPRTEMLLDYITDFEHGHYQLPVIGADEEFRDVAVNPMYRAHRSVTVADVYAPGKWNSHLPDDFAAMALCHRAIKALPQPVTTSTEVRKDGTVRKADAQFHPPPEETVIGRSGEVTIVDERYQTTVDLNVVPEEDLVPSGSRDPWEAMSL